MRDTRLATACAPKCVRRKCAPRCVGTILRSNSRGALDSADQRRTRTALLKRRMLPYQAEPSRPREYEYSVEQQQYPRPQVLVPRSTGYTGTQYHDGQNNRRGAQEPWVCGIGSVGIFESVRPLLWRVGLARSRTVPFVAWLGKGRSANASGPFAGFVPCR